MKAIHEPIEDVRVIFFKNGIFDHSVVATSRANAILDGEAWKRKARENTYHLESPIKF